MGRERDLFHRITETGAQILSRGASVAKRYTQPLTLTLAALGLTGIGFLPIPNGNGGTSGTENMNKKPLCTTSIKPSRLHEIIPIYPGKKNPWPPHTCIEM